MLWRILARIAWTLTIVALVGLAAFVGYFGMKAAACIGNELACR